MVDDFESLSEELARTTTECDRLREENLRLHELLDEARGQSREPLIESPEKQQRSHVASPEASNPPILVETVSPELSVWQKIALFRSLFRGREDVYAVRWEGANGKCGYSPASIRDWDALRFVPKSE